MDAEHARDRIAEEQARVRGLMDDVRTDLGQVNGASGGEPGVDDQREGNATTETFDRERDFSLLEELEAELAELEAALRRIDDGTYGIDEVTGEAIAAERLDAVPAARTNVGSVRTGRAGTEPFGRSGTEPAS